MYRIDYLKETGRVKFDTRDFQTLLIGLVDSVQMNLDRKTLLVVASIVRSIELSTVAHLEDPYIEVSCKDLLKIKLEVEKQLAIEEKELKKLAVKKPKEVKENKLEPLEEALSQEVDKNTTEEVEAFKEEEKIEIKEDKESLKEKPNK